MFITMKLILHSLRERFPAHKAKLDAVRSDIVTHGSIIHQLKVWELQDIGVQASEKILAAKDPLQALIHIRWVI